MEIHNSKPCILIDDNDNDYLFKTCIIMLSLRINGSSTLRYVYLDAYKSCMEELVKLKKKIFSLNIRSSDILIIDNYNDVTKVNYFYKNIH